MSRRQSIVTLFVLLTIIAFAGLALDRATAAPEAESTTRVSVSSSGAEAKGASLRPSISGDGRYVAFQSAAANLVTGDTNRYADIFVHDRQTGQTTRVSVNSAGEQGNFESITPSISARDGRFVAFQSESTNLVANDTNGYRDIFVHDRQTGQTTRVSVSSTGAQANGHSYNPAISADGRYVAFASHANNLVPDDTNGIIDVFVHDRQTGQTTRVSVNSNGQQAQDIHGDHWSDFPSISADGRYVAFQSSANGLVTGDLNHRDDVFVHDRQTRQTTMVSVSSSGEPGNDYSRLPSISGDGRYVAFESAAINLVPNDPSQTADIFVHDRQTRQTMRVSVSSAGKEGNGPSESPAISGDGRYVAFESIASNLVPNDTNGTFDIFAYDLQSGTTTRLSVNSSGRQANRMSERPAVSASGLVVAFESLATDLVPNDTNGAPDIFVRVWSGVGVPPPTATAMPTASPTPVSTATPGPTLTPSSPTPTSVAPVTPAAYLYVPFVKN